MKSYMLLIFGPGSDLQLLLPSGTDRPADYHFLKQAVTDYTVAVAVTDYTTAPAAVDNSNQESGSDFEPWKSWPDFSNQTLAGTEYSVGTEHSATLSAETEYPAALADETEDPGRSVLRYPLTNSSVLPLSFLTGPAAQRFFRQIVD
jgi:hypothetical protein